MDDHKIIPDYQHGFCRGISTSHQLVRVSDYIAWGLNFARPYNSIGVFLDVSQAFDKVWHKGLLFKLMSLNCPYYLVKVIHNYLNNRSFRVRLDSTLSSEREIKAGVPQGAVLSPTLFNIYVHDIPVLPQVHIAQFADDTTLLYRGRNTPFMIEKMQSALESMQDWTEEWRIKINPSKSHAVFFCLRQRPIEDKLTFSGAPIEWTPKVKYLGIHLDHTLRFYGHVTQTIHKAWAAFHTLKSLLTSPRLRRRVHLYKAIIVPKLTYGCSVWHTIPPYQMKRLQATQCKMLRRITGALPYVRNRQLLRDLRLPGVKEKISIGSEPCLQI